MPYGQPDMGETPELAAALACSSPFGFHATGGAGRCDGGSSAASADPRAGSTAAPDGLGNIAGIATIAGMAKVEARPCLPVPKSRRPPACLDPLVVHGEGEHDGECNGLAQLAELRSSCGFTQLIESGRSPPTEPRLSSKLRRMGFEPANRAASCEEACWPTLGSRSVHWPLERAPSPQPLRSIFLEGHGDGDEDTGGGGDGDRAEGSASPAPLRVTALARLDSGCRGHEPKAEVLSWVERRLSAEEPRSVADAAAADAEAGGCGDSGLPAPEVQGSPPAPASWPPAVAMVAAGGCAPAMPLMRSSSPLPSALGAGTERVAGPARCDASLAFSATGREGAPAERWPQEVASGQCCSLPGLGSAVRPNETFVIVDLASLALGPITNLSGSCVARPLTASTGEVQRQSAFR